MAANFGPWTVRSMDIRSKYTVYGYIRNSECNVQIKEKVYLLCLIFYYEPQDYFTQFGHDIATDSGGILKKYVTSIIKLGKTASIYNTAYGKNLISPFSNNIHRWILKIHRSNGECFIGIDSSDRSPVNDKFVSDIYNEYGYWNNLQQFYAISSNGYKYSHYANGKQQCNHLCFGSGDKIKIILDFSKQYGSLSISINDDKYIKVFYMMQKSKSNPDYRLGISLSVGSYIELINYCYSNGELDLYSH